MVLQGATWADFQRVLEIRGDRPVPRLAYLKGRLELMSPSRSHESIKSTLGRLVETYCLWAGVDFRTVGSWTLESKRAQRAVEPDECWILGPDDQDRPTLAVEVIWTSGGLDKLEIYRKLRVREVWVWRKDQITAHALRRDRFEPIEQSEVLPGIDLGLLASFLDEPTSEAMRAYRTALEARQP